MSRGEIEIEVRDRDREVGRRERRKRKGETAMPCPMAGGLLGSIPRLLVGMTHPYDICGGMPFSVVLLPFSVTTRQCVALIEGVGG